MTLKEIWDTKVARIAQRNKDTMDRMFDDVCVCGHSKVNHTKLNKLTNRVQFIGACACGTCMEFVMKKAKTK